MRVECRTGIRLYPKNEPEEITEVLGLSPTILRREGELINLKSGAKLRSKRNVWAMLTEHTRCDSQSTGNQLSLLLSKIFQSWDKTKNLIHEDDLSASIYVKNYGSPTLAIDVSREMLALLTSMKMKLGFDIYNFRGEDKTPDNNDQESDLPQEEKILSMSSFELIETHFPMSNLLSCVHPEIITVNARNQEEIEFLFISSQLTQGFLESKIEDLFVNLEPLWSNLTEYGRNFGINLIGFTMIPGDICNTGINFDPKLLVKMRELNANLTVQLEWRNLHEEIDESLEN